MILTFGILFLEIFSHAGDGAAGAHAANEVSDFPFSVFPDFGASGVVMRVGVRRIFILIGVKRIWNFAGEFCGHGVIAARIFGFDGGGANDYFGAERFEQINFFARLLVGDGEDDFIAAHAGDQRESHAGVAGSSFDDGAAGFQFAGTFGFIDHPQADAVFHRAAGIHVVGLDPDFGGKAFGQFIQANDRRVADRFENVVALHVGVFAPADARVGTIKSREIGKMRQGRRAGSFGD